ncbi:MAG: MmgE/PrpD family protein [Chelatococcus sp.]|uniref:MmgE/PrpD family protein n=1 Tax=Chelatococcus sp. TaxID=1953771 RepID=UPI0025B902D9|nr:MmgE/PrpD family protein [Chelatococcus sp.]MBX3539466.1 MmgE/PrpD family protein [Chelatococcus sp.]
MTALNDQLQPVVTEPSETARALAALAASLKLADVPAGVLHHAKLILRDTLGVMLGGSQLPEIRNLARLAPMLAPGKASLFGTDLTAASHVAALVNGAGGVSLELDEGNQFAVNHPGVHIIPGLWALAEEEGASGAVFLEAVIIGYEIAVRVGRATKLRGPVHPFGTHAIVGTAVGAAHLMGFDEAMTARTIELAAGLPIASSQMAANTGASVRNLFTGFTNHNGLLAPRFVRAGFCGEPGALSSVFGAILGERFALDVEPRFTEFFLTRNYFKIYACSRWNHAPIEAARDIRVTHDVKPSDIASVTVHTYDPATRLGGNTVANAYAAKHSIAFNVAVQLMHGSNDADVYTDAIVHDPAMVALIGKVAVTEDPALTALLPGVRAARVEIALTSGKTYSARSDVPIGGFDNPLPEGELRAKFRRLAALALPDEAIDNLERVVAGLETAERIEAI